MQTVFNIDAKDDILGPLLEPELRSLTDAQLLGRFVEGREASAFEVLMQRHGPMVLGVCRRFVRNRQDAEDAYQATFLVLVLKAAAIQPREMVGNWLYGVAVKTALKARAQTHKRRGRECQVTEMPDRVEATQPPAELPGSWGDAQELLDQELARLPDIYRAPIVLCDLEGKSRKDAAKQLGWLDGTLSGRLARGRKLLAERLARRGLVFASGSLAFILAEGAALASVPGSLAASTVQVASQLTSNPELLRQLASSPVARLVEGVLKSAGYASLKKGAALACAGFVLAGAILVAVWLANRRPASEFLGLGDLLAGKGESHAFGVSDDGRVVVGHARTADGGYEAFFFNAEQGMLGLGDAPGGEVNSVVWRVSGDGRVGVGQVSTANGMQAVRWKDGRATLLGDLPGGKVSSIAFGTSFDGAVVVGVSESANGPEAFRWTETEGMVGLGDVPGGAFNSLASDVSASGDVICGNGAGLQGTVACRWTLATGIQPLGEPADANESQAAAISNDGRTIVGFTKSAAGHEAFRWTKQTGMVPLGHIPDGLDSFATAVSRNGHVVVGAARTPAGERAIVWDPKNGISNLQDFLANEAGLNLTGWTLTHARDISVDGRMIAGYGINPRGQVEAWVVRLDRPPGAP